MRKAEKERERDRAMTDREHARTHAETETHIHKDVHTYISNHNTYTYIKINQCISLANIPPPPRQSGRGGRAAESGRVRVRHG